LKKSFLNLFIQMKNFSCMSSSSYKNNIQWWSYENDLLRKRRRADFILIKFSISIHHFHQVLDVFDQRIVFEFFHTDKKISFACHQIHTKMTLNADRRYYRSKIMIEIENLIKIKFAKHASQSSDSRYSYAYIWNIEYWWSWETYKHESILLLKFQANKWWFREVMMIE
jgi:hypothetical protein